MLRLRTEERPLELIHARLLMVALKESRGLHEVAERRDE